MRLRNKRIGILMMAIVIGLSVLWFGNAPLVSAASDAPYRTDEKYSNELKAVFVVQDESETSDPSPSAPSPAPSSEPTSRTEQITVAVETGEPGAGSEISKAVIYRTKGADGRITDEVTFESGQAKQTVERAKLSGQATARIMIPDDRDEVSRIEIKLPKESLQALAGGGLNLEIYTQNVRIVIPNVSLADAADDFYFRVIPIRDQSERRQVEERARVERAVKDTAGDRTIAVVGRPMTIETNMSSRQADIVLPLLGADLPKDDKEREAYLADMGVFIEHSDGERVLVKPQVVSYNNGGSGLKFDVRKFSTFTILHIDGWSDEGATQQKQEHAAYVTGYPDGTFKPDRGITRAEMAAMLSRIGAASEEGRQATGTSSFPDLPATHWASDAIVRVAKAGLMSGYPDGTFGPEAGITRAQLAVILARWLAIDAGSGGQQSSSFSDIAGHWAERNIAAVEKAGVMAGMPDGTFQPDRVLTRAEAVKVLNAVTHRGPLSATVPTWSDVAVDHWAFGQIEEASRTHRSIRNNDGIEVEQ